MLISNPNNFYDFLQEYEHQLELALESQVKGIITPKAIELYTLTPAQRTAFAEALVAWANKQQTKKPQ